MVRMHLRAVARINRAVISPHGAAGLVGTALFFALLSGCATFSPDGGMSLVNEVASHELDRDQDRRRCGRGAGDG
jgi:hypothetical protein